MAQTLGISRERVGFIIHDVVDLRKISVKWEPWCLNADQKRGRVVGSKEILEHFRGNTAIFLAQHVTINEKWIHSYDTETKAQYKDSIYSSSTRSIFFYHSSRCPR